MKKKYFEIAVGAFGLGFKKDRNDQYSALDSLWVALSLLACFNLFTIVLFTMDIIGIPRNFLFKVQYVALGIGVVISAILYWWIFIGLAKIKIEMRYREATDVEKRRLKKNFVIYGMVSIGILFAVGLEVLW